MEIKNKDLKRNTVDIKTHAFNICTLKKLAINTVGM